MPFLRHARFNTLTIQVSPQAIREVSRPKISPRSQSKPTKARFFQPEVIVSLVVDMTWCWKITQKNNNNTTFWIMGKNLLEFQGDKTFWLCKLPASTIVFNKSRLEPPFTIAVDPRNLVVLMSHRVSMQHQLLDPWLDRWLADQKLLNHLAMSDVRRCRHFVAPFPTKTYKSLSYKFYTFINFIHLKSFLAFSGLASKVGQGALVEIGERSIGASHFGKTIDFTIQNGLVEERGEVFAWRLHTWCKSHDLTGANPTGKTRDQKRFGGLQFTQPCCAATWAVGGKGCKLASMRSNRPLNSCTPSVPSQMGADVVAMAWGMPIRSVR